MGTIINHYKDPYQTTSIMESKRVFFVDRVNAETFPKPSSMGEVSA